MRYDYLKRVKSGGGRRKKKGKMVGKKYNWKKHKHGKKKLG